MEREQFTFYQSFERAISRIKKKADRCDAYDAIVRYALYEELPDLERIAESAAIAFELSKPNLDASRRKAKSGKIGGEVKPTQSKAEAISKQTAIKTQANDKQIESKKEGEKENKKEIENKCYSGAQKNAAKEDGFDTFWKAYPKKTGDIREAYTEYMNAISSGATLEQMLNCLKWQVPEWTKDGTRYIPSPEKWLRNKGWLATRTAKPNEKTEEEKAKQTREQFEAFYKFADEMKTRHESLQKGEG